MGCLYMIGIKTKKIFFFLFGLDFFFFELNVKPQNA